MGVLYQRALINKVLVVCPASVVSVWEHDMARFAAYPYELAALSGTKPQRLKALDRLQASPHLQVAVINYESTHRDGIEEALAAYGADLIICDESQRIKNHSAAQSKAMHALGAMARYRLILSGTPVQNNAADLFSQYKFLDPSVFGPSYYAFRGRYCVMGGYGQHQIVGYRHMDELVAKEHSIGLRVTKADALDLPDQVFARRYVQLPPKAAEIYRQMRNNARAELEGGEITAQIVLTKLLRLQQLTGGYITPDGEETPQEVHTAKLEALDDIVQDVCLDNGDKLVIFARFRAELDAICARLEAARVPYGRIDGSVPTGARGEIVEAFQASPGPRCFVAQLQTAGLGITLHAASVAVFYSLDFSYANYQQAVARIHRIGQAQKCTYIHLLASGTVDEHVMEALDDKADLAHVVVDDWRRLFE